MQKNQCLSPLLEPLQHARQQQLAGLTAACARSRAFRLRPFFASTVPGQLQLVETATPTLRHFVHLCLNSVKCVNI